MNKTVEDIIEDIENSITAIRVNNKNLSVESAVQGLETEILQLKIALGLLD